MEYKQNENRTKLERTYKGRTGQADSEDVQNTEDGEGLYRAFSNRKWELSRSDNFDVREVQLPRQ